MTSSQLASKRSILKWIGLALLLLFGWFLWSLFGPNPPIVVSKQTTYITAPLAADGLPDYEAYLLQEMRKHKPKREDNAAVAMWQTMGPGDMDPADWKLLEQELGSLEPPEGVKRLEDPYGKDLLEAVDDWLAKQPAPLKDCEASSIVDAAFSRPWTASQFPPIAEWVRQNESALNLLVECSKRNGFYSPPPSILDNKQDKISEVLIPHAQYLRNGVRSLNLRAMLQLGEDNVDAATTDVVAGLSYADRMRPSYFVVESLVSIAIMMVQTDFACRILPMATERELRLLRAALADKTTTLGIADSINNGERLLVLDSVVNGTISELANDFETENDQRVDLAGNLGRLIRTDRNIILGIVNDHFDRLQSAFENELWNQSQHSLDACEAAALGLENSSSKSIRNLGRVAFSSRERSEIAGSMYLTWLRPPADTALAAEHRGRCNLQLLKCAVEIELDRKRFSRYPDNLDSVAYAGAVDRFHGHPLVYRPVGDGFLLYSRGANGIDDRGNCERGQWGAATFEGQELFDDEDPRHEQIPEGADDISLRIPVEYPPWPWKRKKEEE